MHPVHESRSARERRDAANLSCGSSPRVSRSCPLDSSMAPSRSLQGSKEDQGHRSALLNQAYRRSQNFDDVACWRHASMYLRFQPRSHQPRCRSGCHCSLCRNEPGSTGPERYRSLSLRIPLPEMGEDLLTSASTGTIRARGLLFANRSGLFSCKCVSQLGREGFPWEIGFRL